MLFAWLGLLLNLLTSPGPAFAADAVRESDAAQGYRLAGTIAVGNGYMAILALPQGGQALVREGSRIDGATILAVRSEQVRLQLANGVFDLFLAGTGKSAPTAASTAVIDSTTDARNGVYVREVSVDQLSRRLDKSSVGTTTAGVSGSPGGDVAAQRIAAAIELPPGSRILSVSGQRVTSADAAIRAIESAFASGREGVILDITSPKGPGRAYINRDKP